jgi:DNA-binding transcriptional MerR regulator
MKIKDISDKYDITARSLRYYEDMGLICSARSDEYAYRLYDETNVKKIEQILILRKLNISIRDIQRIFSSPDSAVVLEVLGQKVQNIDDEVALLHELKEIMIEFIHHIEKMDFCNDAHVKLLYSKAQEIESHLTSVDYIGKPSNIGRLLEAAEKLEREPDILLIEMPPCRMLTSGILMDDGELTRFEAVWNRLASRIVDKINPRDFMYYDTEHGKNVWMYMVEDWMTEADTQGYPIVPFEGGLYASALALSWEFSEYDRVSKGIGAWLNKQEHLEADENSNRLLLYHFAGPHSQQMKDWNYGKVRYLVPIRVN